jgi:hypothetical protein
LTGSATPRRLDPGRRVGLGGHEARLDHVVLVAGFLVTAVGAYLPWIKGVTKTNGFVDWNGMSDTGDGLIILGFGLLAMAFVRWRGHFESIEPRTRWLPFVVAIAAAFIWIIAFRKAAYLTYDEVDVGARPAIGLLVTAAGIVLMLAGGWLAAHDPRRRAAEPPPRPAVGGRDVATGDQYSVRGPVEPRPPSRD